MFDSVAELSVAVKEVAAEDRAGWGPPAVSDRVLGLAAVSERLTAEYIRVLAQWDHQVAWGLDGFLSGATWLTGRLPVSDYDARALLKLASLYRRYPVVAAALDGGDIGIGHLKVLARDETGHEQMFEACAAGLVMLAVDHPLIADFNQVMDEWRRLVDDTEPPDDTKRAFRSNDTFGGRAHASLDTSSEDLATIRAAIEALDTPDPPDCPEGPRTRVQRHHDIVMDIFGRVLADQLGHDPDSTGTADVILDADTAAELMADPDDAEGRLDVGDPENRLDDFFGRHHPPDPHGHPRHHCDGGCDHDEPAERGPAGDRGPTGEPDHEAGEGHDDTAAQTDAGRTGDGPVSELHDHSAEADDPGAAAGPAGFDDDCGHCGPAGVAHGGRRCELPTGVKANLAFASVLLCTGWVRRIARDPITGNVVDLGRRQRLFSRTQRRALVYRDRGCVFPGCDRGPRWCDAHHLTPWEEGGLTDLVNGVLLCRRHHVLVHQGWRLERNAGTGIVTATSPDGRAFHRHPDNPHSPHARC